MSDLTPEIVNAALSIRGPGGISQSRTLTGSDHVIREAAQKWANLPDLDDEVRAAIQRAYIAGYTDGVHDGAMPVEWEIETESINQWMGSELVTALGITENTLNELRPPGPIRELSEILDNITEDE